MDMELFITEEKKMMIQENEQRILFMSEVGKRETWRVEKIK